MRTGDDDAIVVSGTEFKVELLLLHVVTSTHSAQAAILRCTVTRKAHSNFPKSERYS